MGESISLEPKTEGRTEEKMVMAKGMLKAGISVDAVSEVSGLTKSKFKTYNRQSS